MNDEEREIRSLRWGITEGVRLSLYDLLGPAETYPMGELLEEHLLREVHPSWVRPR